VVPEGDTSYPRREPAPLPVYPDAARRSRPPRPPLTKRMRRGHWIALDCVAGGVFAVVEMAVVAHGPGVVAVPAVLLLGVAVFVPVALRRLAPVAAFGALIILAALLAAEGFGPAVIFVAAASVLYLVAVTSNRRTSAAALGLGLIVTLLIMITDHRLKYDGGAGALVPVMFALAICWITGYSIRQRRLYAQMLQDQATSSAVAEERLRIARELHDVVAHSMSVIAVQAGYGQYVIDTSPDGARDALGAIQATSRDALEEMRRMLGVLRQQDAAAAPAPAVAAPLPAPGTADPAADPAADSAADSAAVPAAAAAAREAAAGASGAPGTLGAPAAARATTGISAPLAPAPGLARLSRLIERTNGAGVQVSLECSGQVRAVPAGVDLSAYRIIQEALTNVVKHAGGGAHCVICLDYDEEALHIRVTDDGGGSLVLSPASPGALGVPVGGTGHGIIGMRERANLCGGDFSAGALPGGGFEVNATLPLLGAAAADGSRAGTGGLT
jgi:signal transduction histidine kinase